MSVPAHSSTPLGTCPETIYSQDFIMFLKLIAAKLTFATGLFLQSHFTLQFVDTGSICV
jgi:hypothetical protein